MVLSINRPTNAMLKTVNPAPIVVNHNQGTQQTVVNTVIKLQENIKPIKWTIPTQITFNTTAVKNANDTLTNVLRSILFIVFDYKSQVTQ